MSGASERAGMVDDASCDAESGCCKANSLVASVLGDGLLQAEVFGAVEQFEQLAALDAIDLVARAFDLGAAHFVAELLGLGLGLARRLPGSLVEFGAVLEAVGERRRGGEHRHNKH